MEGLKISIPEPCSQNWELMEQHEKSRFCSKCRRHLTDFTEFADTELVQYLIRNEGKICGKFRQSQLDRPLLSEFHTARPNRSFVMQRILALSLLLPFQISASANTTFLQEFSVHFSYEDQAEKSDQRIFSDDPPLIRGRVTDGQTGEPISFAYIRVEGTHIGAACDVGGYFSILIPEESGHIHHLHSYYSKRRL
jgi:hypothetical protein